MIRTEGNRDMELRAGSRLRSAVCETEVIVVRCTDDSIELRCGGSLMLPMDANPPNGSALDPAHADGTALGKRYTDGDGSIELLCTKPGTGSLSTGAEVLVLKETEPLPSSD